MARHLLTTINRKTRLKELEMFTKITTTTFSLITLTTCGFLCLGGCSQETIEDTAATTNAISDEVTNDNHSPTGRLSTE
jgi:hypothetical protein